MKNRMIMTGFGLLTLILAGGSHANAAVAPMTRVSAGDIPRLVVFYFHGTSRCRTCLTIEKYTRQAVKDGFAGELERGEMELRTVNVDLEENQHFIQDYQLFSRSVVLSHQPDGKETAWKRLDRVWELVRSEPDFIQYIQDEIRAMRQAERK